MAGIWQYAIHSAIKFVLPSTSTIDVKIFSNYFSKIVGFGGVLSVVATSVYGMDHTGDHHHDDGEPGHDVPVESGDRSQALLAELAEAERARIRAEARVSQLIVDIDRARTIEASQHSDARIQALEASSAADDISLDLGLTAGAVTHRIDEYTFIVTYMPLLWARHQNGRIDAWRLHIIAETTRDTLVDPASYTILDEKLAAWLDGRVLSVALFDGVGVVMFDDVFGVPEPRQQVLAGLW